MAIKKIHVSNFKSFKDLTLELGNFNVVIGANASGKSNFTQIFKFLKDTKDNGLKDAISMHGGLESLRNLKIGAASDFNMRIESEARSEAGGILSLKTNKIAYEFSLRFEASKSGYEIASDELTQKLQITRSKGEEKALFEDEGLGTVEFTIANVNGKPDISFGPPEMKDLLEKEEAFPPLSFFPKLFGEEIPSGVLLINTPYFAVLPGASPFGDIAIYDIDPHLARNPVQITGKAELAEDGKNLALVLNKLIEDGEKKRKFCNLMKDLLPFCNDIDTEKFAEKSLMMKIQEDYYGDEYLSAYLLSDGTINISALIIALCLEEKDTVIVEEPERNIHPHLISRVVDMMKDASRHRQVIVTTHSAELVKQAGLENILLVSRDQDGFSRISRPREKSEVKLFLQNELGLDELYVQDLLSV